MESAEKSTAEKFDGHVVGGATDNAGNADRTLAVPDSSDDPSPLDGVMSSSASSVRPAPSAKAPPIAQFIYKLPKKLKPVLSQQGIAHVKLDNGGNPFVLRVGSRKLDNLIRTLAVYEDIRLHQSDIKEANDHLISYAELAGIVENIWYRVAPIHGGIEIDLGDKQGTRVRVTPGKVEVIPTGSETLFYTSSATRPMVMPAQEGNLKLLKGHVNLHDVDFMLFIAWLSYTLAC